MTIKDIAKEAGYAVGTVSRVLNNHPDVSPEAKQRVLAVVAAHNFTPNSNAKHLKQQGNQGVAVIVKGTRNVLFAGILELAQTEIRRRGYPSFVTYIDEEDNEVEQALRLCRERKPLGILFLGSYLPHFAQSFQGIHVPCVLVTNSARELNFSNLSSVTTDDVAAAEHCIRYLAGQGHRRIGVLGGISCGSDASRARLDGCQKGFTACGLPFDLERQYQSARFSMDSGYAAMEKLLETFPEMTAVFAFSDVMALGALRALADHNKRVPQDISLIGFDGIEAGRFSTPRLTTVRQADEALAGQGAELLLEQIEHHAAPVHRTVSFRLLEGESVQNLTERDDPL